MVTDYFDVKLETKDLILKKAEFDFRILGKDLENCSITELQWDEKNERFTLECFNDHAHLDKYPELLRSGWKG